MARKKTNNNGDELLPLEARCIQHIQDFPAPKTTQDAVDQLAAELAVASLLRSNAEKRYENIKRRVLNDHEQAISDVRTKASDTMTKCTSLLYGEDFVISLNANRPAMRCDVDELRTELVRMGVKVDTIDKAIQRVTKKATPALIISAAPLTVE